MEPIDLIKSKSRIKKLFTILLLFSINLMINRDSIHLFQTIIRKRKISPCRLRLFVVTNDWFKYCKLLDTKIFENSYIKLGQDYDDSYEYSKNGFNITLYEKIVLEIREYDPYYFDDFLQIDGNLNTVPINKKNCFI